MKNVDKWVFIYLDFKQKKGFNKPLKLSLIFF